ncbi:hypothetical protein DdX_01489 [Ditylenchus destructor]|uniref:Uncharacterized protein n=1 Tax=Ditylenchus destructor TaxID=166010 RepID=A0AAD4R847_9BILA|nr:hypothetical protein DdX_01489 [Ditylenchus destructor]
MADEKEVVPDYSKFSEDSVPLPEREVKHTHPGRPDLDYEDTPVGPAPGVDLIPADEEKCENSPNEEK